MTIERNYRGSIVITPPGIFGQWAFQLMSDAAVASDPPLQVQVLDRHDIVNLESAAQTVFLVRFPSDSVKRIVDAGLLPVVAFLDFAKDAIAFHTRTANCSFVDALRAATSAASINPNLRGGLSTLVLRRDQFTNATDLVERVLDHLAIKIPAAALASLKSRYAERDFAPMSVEESLAQNVQGYFSKDLGTDDLAAEQLTFIEQALEPLLEMSISADMQPIVWPAGLFLSGDRPNERAPVVADMVGGARIIYYGPYLCLPAGAYEVEITVGFSSDAVGYPFTVEVYGSALLARARFQAKETGLFTGVFYFVHTQIGDQLELRFRNDQGAIEGKFGLAWVKLILQKVRPS
jgi:hypothetical protein